MAKITLTGRLTDLIGTKRLGQAPRYMVQVSLERDPCGKVPLSERYYCTNYYVGAEEAQAFQPGRPVRITIEQD